MIRVEKYLSEKGTMSRREAKKYIGEGLIRINNKVAQAGDKFDPEKDTLHLSPKIKKSQGEKMTIAVYKPRGYVSSKDTEHKNIFDVFPKYKHLNTVGRLDKESEGLILLSNDGMITKAITGKDHNIEKEYLVHVREEFLPWMAKKMSEGIKLEDGWTLPAKAVKDGIYSFKITLREGRKHQIRRMANACKLTITSLKRIRIHDIKIGGMLPGNFKKLDNDQVGRLKDAGKVAIRK